MCTYNTNNQIFKKLCYFSFTLLSVLLCSNDIGQCERLEKVLCDSSSSPVDASITNDTLLKGDRRRYSHKGGKVKTFGIDLIAYSMPYSENHLTTNFKTCLAAFKKIIQYRAEASRIAGKRVREIPSQNSQRIIILVEIMDLFTKYKEYTI